MAKIILKDDEGNETEVREITGIGEHGVIVLHMHCLLRPLNIQELEDEMYKKFQRKVIILDSKFDTTIHCI